ncbi:PepSY-associated TM helix domain-containing protein [Kiloniella laminariae]|uniref:PepSY-associated TM helix domain-containing protein n=1 Tax=Kiloniella laminariae TaxID=454162 RepID=UPI00037E5202|nr:PepSY domain-containing protein [Kiloniella laminariae]
MTDMTATNMPVASQAYSGLYKAVWRWHFYAGLLVLPFMISLAVTGALYLFDDELDSILYRAQLQVEQGGREAISHTDLVAAAVLAVPEGKSFSYSPPASENSSAKVGVKNSEGERLFVYVNPYDAEILGVVPREGHIMRMVQKIHSLAYFGEVANYVIEIVACWAIMLTITGVYLWWPRGQAGGVVTVRGTPKKRMFWRDIHAVLGLFTAGFITFLAMTGLPWSVWWGAETNRLAAESGLGYPPNLWDEVPSSTVPSKDAMGQISWSLENAPMPLSTAVEGAAAAIGLDAAVKIFDGHSITPGYSIDLPSDAEGVYSASIFPDQLDNQRMIHLDQYSGEALIDLRYEDYGPVAKAMEWGINVHMGQEFGLVNQLVLLVVCLSIIMMAVSGAVMWWKRRPAGSLGVPRVPADYRLAKGVLFIALALCLIFPLMGASLIVALIIDFVVTRVSPAKIS